MERAVDRYTLDLTINFPDREVDVSLRDARSLSEQQDMLTAIVEQYPQATSFAISLVRVTHTIEEHPWTYQ